jgi:ABC-type uncharacterized transport system substrate-binding protein
MAAHPAIAAGRQRRAFFKGISPGELPVQSAEKFELAVNLKAAKALGLTCRQRRPT